MILHVTFSDGSNPWVSLPTDRHTIAKHWRRWMKYHPDTAYPVVFGKSHQVVYIESDSPKKYYIIPKIPYHGQPVKAYRHLGHALAARDSGNYRRRFSVSNSGHFGYFK